jgi:hypothetical protein
MSINIVEICRLKYPGQVEAWNITFRQPEEDILIDTWNVEGVEQPTEASLLAEASIWEPIYQLNLLKATSRGLIQNLLDTTAQAKTYNDALHCVSYGLSTNTQWLAEATAFIAWRDNVYETSLAILDGVENNNDPVPTETEFLNALPTITWP